MPGMTTPRPPGSVPLEAAEQWLAPGACPIPAWSLRGVSFVLATVLLMVAGAGAAPAQIDPPSIDELVAKAARQGTLRVIVEVLPDGSAPYTSEAIAQAQDRVLQELAGTSHRVIRRYATIPFLGLTVSVDALRRLAGSRSVGGLREDRLRMRQ